MSQLSQAVKSDLAGYVTHLTQRVTLAVNTLPAEHLWTKPYPYGNSLGNLLLHLTGNLNHYIGARIAGTGYVRNRDWEFNDPGGYPASEILQRFEEAVQLTLRTLQSLDEEALAAPIGIETPYRTVFGQFLVCAAHINYHVGQIYYILQSFGYDTDEPPSW